MLIPSAKELENAVLISVRLEKLPKFFSMGFVIDSAADVASFKDSTANANAFSASSFIGDGF